MGGKQLGFSDYEQTTAKKRTKKVNFLAEMDQVVPWQPLLDLIEPTTQRPAAKVAVRRIPWRGMAMKQGTIIDTSLISASSSTKNKTGERDPEMHQTKKGNQWYFGMKVHIGVDKDSDLIHSVETTSANVHDITRAAQLLHGEGEKVDAH